MIDYTYETAEHSHAHAYLLPSLLRLLEEYHRNGAIFDVGCGNGSVDDALTQNGYEVVGIDASEDGIEQANKAFPELQLDVGSAYDDLAGKYGTFDTVISLEVVEHLYAPRDFARTVAGLLNPGGRAIISTPYHGYLKNVAIAVTGYSDKHYTALWDHGHIKFWSIATLTELMAEAGLTKLEVLRVGRIPILGKSMMICFEKA